MLQPYSAPPTLTQVPQLELSVAFYSTSSSTLVKAYVFKPEDRKEKKNVAETRNLYWFAATLTGIKASGLSVCNCRLHGCHMQLQRHQRSHVGGICGFRFSPLTGTFFVKCTRSTYTLLHLCSHITTSCPTSYFQAVGWLRSM